MTVEERREIDFIQDLQEEEIDEQADLVEWLNNFKAGIFLD